MEVVVSEVLCREKGGRECRRRRGGGEGDKEKGFRKKKKIKF